MKKEELMQMFIDREIDKGFNCRLDTANLNTMYQAFEKKYEPKDNIFEFDLELSELTFAHSRNGFIVGFETAIELLSTLKEI